MAIFVAFCFLGEILLKGFIQIDVALIGQAQQNPENIGHFISQVSAFVTFLF